MSTTAQRILLAAGVGFAALLLAQAYFRSGTPALSAGEWIKSAHERENNTGIDEAIKRFGQAASMDWKDIADAMFDDLPMFKQAVGFGASESTPGVIANLGGVEGRPYVLIDDAPYLMNGR